MKYFVLIGTAAAILSACGVKGDLIRAEGQPEPKVVVTSTINDGSTEPTKPRGTLF